MKLGIFTVDYKMMHSYVASDVFIPFITGLKIGPHPHILTDESGDNIAAKGSYCEMRAQYFVWKNLLPQYDYIGFQHYRRYFFYPFLGDSPQFCELRACNSLFAKNTKDYCAMVPVDVLQNYMAFLRNLSPAEVDQIKERIGSVDIVVPRSMKCDGGSLKSQYLQFHWARHWNALERVLKQNQRFQEVRPQLDLDIPEIMPCNMYIMRRSLFDDYMKLWWDVSTELEKVIRLSKDPYQSRVFAFLAERIFTVYFYHLRMEHPALRVLELPVLFANHIRQI